MKKEEFLEKFETEINAIYDVLKTFDNGDDVSLGDDHYANGIYSCSYGIYIDTINDIEKIEKILEILGCHNIKILQVIRSKGDGISNWVTHAGDFYVWVSFAVKDKKIFV